MHIKLNKGKTFPGCNEQFATRGYLEIRVVAFYYDKWSTYKQCFVDTKVEFDKLPYLCHTLSILFEDGSNVELPLEAFNRLFTVIPEGELTNALYGNL